MLKVQYGAVVSGMAPMIGAGKTSDVAPYVLRT